MDLEFGCIKVNYGVDNERGTYSMTIDGLNTVQAMSFVNQMKKWEEEKTYDHNGSIHRIPCGKMKGKYLEEAGAEYGYPSLVQLLESMYLFGKEKIMRGVSPYKAIELFNEEVLWMIPEIEFLPTKTLVEAFANFLPDPDGTKKRIESLDAREPGWSIQQEREKVVDAIYEKFRYAVPILVNDVAILSDDYTIPYGENEGLTFKRVYEEKSLYALVQQMLIAEKGSELFIKCKAQIACLLKYAINLVPYEDFISAFARFFRLNDAEVMAAIQQPDDVKEKDYEVKVADLLQRIKD